MSQNPEQQLADLLEKLHRNESRNRLQTLYSKVDSEMEGAYGHPYPWQVDFHNAGKSYAERCLCAANRVGKSTVGGAETACHAIGWYPHWWEGFRFYRRPPRIWVCSDTNETSRDIVQRSLLGDDEVGIGWIPADQIEKVTYRQAGINNVADTVYVKHSSGGLCSIQFKSYEQGRRKFQGTSQDFIWFDEEPPEDIYDEGITRLVDVGGRCILTFTPLLGVSDVVDRFFSGGRGIYVQAATWEDAPHLTKEEKDRLIATYPRHTLDARTKGIPMMGSGAVYPTLDEDLVISPFEIPPHFRRICGIDFGIDHPAACVWIAYDADADIIYVYDAYKASGEVAAYHSEAIKSRGKWIPVAWPHDGMQREKSSGTHLAEAYESHGVNMMPMSARYDDGKGGAQPKEPVVLEIDERMRSGRFKVFSHLEEWLKEKRAYHRKDGQIVATRDDLMSATQYAVMMKRYAVSTAEQSQPRTSEYASGYNPLGA